MSYFTVHPWGIIRPAVVRLLTVAVSLAGLGVLAHRGCNDSGAETPAPSAIIDRDALWRMPPVDGRYCFSGLGACLDVKEQPDGGVDAWPVTPGIRCLPARGGGR